MGSNTPATDSQDLSEMPAIEVVGIPDKLLLYPINYVL